jgi:hypothetical protein
VTARRLLLRARELAALADQPRFSPRAIEADGAERRLATRSLAKRAPTGRRLRRATRPAVRRWQRGKSSGIEFSVETPMEAMRQ